MDARFGLVVCAVLALFGAPAAADAPVPGTITEFRVPSATGDLSGITAGPDGNLWFTDYEANRIGRITPAGAFTEFPIPTANSGPKAITTGPDGNLWFSEGWANQIGQITPGGAFTEFAIPTPGSEPAGITTGPDGNLWFTEYFANEIGRMTPGGIHRVRPTQPEQWACGDHGVAGREPLVHGERGEPDRPDHARRHDH